MKTRNVTGIFRTTPLSLQLRRQFSASAQRKHAPASQIADSFFAQTQQKGLISQSQLLDGNQIQRLSQTLGRDNVHPAQSIKTNPPTAGTSVPAGYHLVYFTPSALEEELGQDGTDRTFNPDPPFTRRMWAGGEMTWARDNALKIGDTVTENTKILSAVPKKTRSGEEMVVVGVEKRFENENGVALIDRRNWLFRPEITGPSKIVERGATVPFLQGSHTKDLTQTPVSLFRFSALTFNGHKIHYSLPWCREVEGHRGLVVHGPLNLVHILDFWRDTRTSSKGQFPKSIKYRATSPVYADEPYRIVLEDVADGATTVKLWTCEGKIGMEADIQAFD